MCSEFRCVVRCSHDEGEMTEHDIKRRFYIGLVFEFRKIELLKNNSVRYEFRIKSNYVLRTKVYGIGRLA
jgi:hypothetical protein